MRSWILQNQFILLAALSAIGFFILGTACIRLQKKIKTLLGGVSSTDESLPGDLIRRLTRTELKIENLEPRIDRIENIAKLSLQKVGFVRFNPFENTGGDNSFVISLLDQNNDGVLLSSLYTREGVRIYAKSVERGKSRYPLSEEEANLLDDTVKKSND